MLSQRLVGLFPVLLVLYYATVYLTALQRSFWYGGTQSIERQFGLSSAEMGLVGTVSKVGMLVLALPVAYMANKVNRAKWIGVAGFVIALGVLINASPHFIFGGPDHFSQQQQEKNGVKSGAESSGDLCNGYRPPELSETNTNAAAGAANFESAVEPTKGAFYIFLTGSTIIAIGNTVGQAYGIPLIDDNVSKKNTGLFIDPPNMSPNDSNWIGAWWIASLVNGLLLLIPTMILICFPNTLDKRKSATVKKVIKDRDRVGQQDLLLPKTVGQAQNEVESTRSGGWKTELAYGVGIIRSLFQSRLYCFYVGSLLINGLAFRGWLSFLTKYLNNYYSVSQSEASLIMAFTDVMAYSIGCALGSYLIKRIGLSRRRAGTFVLVGFIMYWLLYGSTLFMNCQSTLSKVGELGQEKEFDWSSGCNLGCDCKPSQLKPVCDQDGRPYFSPCFAGCQSFDSQTMLYHNCSCTAEGPSTLSAEFCTNDCKHTKVMYSVVIGLSGMMQGMIAIPSVLFLIRLGSIPSESRSMGLALANWLRSTVGSMPSPYMYGLVIDSSCRLWSYTLGNGEMKGFNGLFFGILAVSLIFHFGIWYESKNVDLLWLEGKKESDTNEKVENDEMETDEDEKHRNPSNTT